MKLRTFAAAGFAIALAGCDHPDGRRSDLQPLGRQSAGKFFAACGRRSPMPTRAAATSTPGRAATRPSTFRRSMPMALRASAASRCSAARKQYLRCQVEITTNADYTIRTIRVSGGIPGVSSPSTAPILAPTQPAAQ